MNDLNMDNQLSEESLVSQDSIIPQDSMFWQKSAVDLFALPFWFGTSSIGLYNASIFFNPLVTADHRRFIVRFYGYVFL